MTIKGETTMHDWQDWESAQIETELLLDKERRERENSATTATGATGATGAKVGCFSILLYIGLGILIFRFFVEVVSIFSR
jgi:hypothetical protein